MSRPCPSCRTNGADYDDPQGLCGECAAAVCDDCGPSGECDACDDDRRHHEDRGTRLEETA